MFPSVTMELNCFLYQNDSTIYPVVSYVAIKHFVKVYKNVCSRRLANVIIKSKVDNNV